MLRLWFNVFSGRGRRWGPFPHPCLRMRGQCVECPLIVPSMPKQRAAAMAAYHRFYRAIKQKACIYCGVRATTVDHFVPISIVFMLIQTGTPIRGKFLLPSCGECNSIAADRLFKTVAAKRRYIHERLRKKYRNLLDMPDWSDEEQEELGWALQTFVRAGMEQKSVLRQRLAWRNINNSMFVDIAKIRFGVLEDGRGSAPRNADIRPRI